MCVCVFFCPFGGGQLGDICANKCCCLEPWKGLGSSVLVVEPMETVRVVELREDVGLNLEAMPMATRSFPTRNRC